jgi:hypothetical protein
MVSRYYRWSGRRRHAGRRAWPRGTGYFVGDVDVAGQVDIAEAINHEEGVISSTVIGEFGSHHVHVFGRGS